MTEVFKPHIDDLSVANKVSRLSDDALDDEIDQYLVNEFNCEFHNKFSLYLIEASINMPEAIFFDLFTTTYEFFSSNYKKPIACINKFKSILKNYLSLPQQILLLDTLQDCFETDGAWNNRDHPQLLVIIHHLQIEQVYALKEYLAIVSEKKESISLRDSLFSNYLYEKRIITKDEREAILNYKEISDDTLILSESIKEQLVEPVNSLLKYFTSEGRKVLPYILEKYQDVKPRNGLTALIIALESFGRLLNIKVTERGKQMTFHEALTENLGKIGTIAALNMSLSDYQNTTDERKKDQIKQIKKEIEAILHTVNQ
ncbi:hypothetical protein [Spirosoma endophyticum]|uniref:Uncharacterized protein n=1 Tax=Spirosoma endophyticum TaxID=662367 RepID=A0A1I2GYJ4_9BACT|nr:hypothetical protein [Spirosoma endophyticum]SFF22328.1 hypothetical protein SAMN05216167_13632 [Spirosoma endophyticum]